VVIVMLGIAISLVGPLTINQVDKFKAKNEELLLQRWIKQASYDAFYSGKAKIFLLDGKSITAQADEGAIVSTDEKPTQIFFNHLFFPPAILSINSNGYITPDSLNYNIRGQKRIYIIADILTEYDEK
jgi:type II secretory pathway pseudopilin PulG